MNNVRMKIAAGATVLGLGGLAGFALGSNAAPPTPAAPVSAPAAAHLKPKVKRQVVHHTVHVRRKPQGTEVSSAATPSGSGTPAAAAPPTPPAAAPAGARACARGGVGAGQPDQLVGAGVHRVERFGPDSACREQQRQFDLFGLDAHQRRRLGLRLRRLHVLGRRR